MTPTIIDLEGVHHGVAVPLSDGYLATFAVDETAVGIVHLDEDGTETDRYDGCDGLHGEAHVGLDSFAFGCKTGVQVVDDTSATSIAAPVEGAGSSTLAGDGETPVVAGNLRAAEEGGPDLSTSIALYDTVAGTSRAVDLGVGFSNMVITEEQLVVIGLDGHLHLVDLLSGEVRTTTCGSPIRSTGSSWPSISPTARSSHPQPSAASPTASSSSTTPATNTTTTDQRLHHATSTTKSR